MEWDDEIASRLMAAIAALPPDEQSEALQAVLSDLIKQMPTDALVDMRSEIAARFVDEDLEIVAVTLDMIDGQMALREIAGSADWR
jgi:predicted lipid carrier protein YhbT